MRKSSAIFVSAIALGLAMVVPLKASAQGVSIYIGPRYPGYAYPAYPRYYGGYPVTVTPQGMAMPIQAMVRLWPSLLRHLLGPWPTRWPPS